jgi:hypothetical protein
MVLFLENVAPFTAIIPGLSLKGEVGLLDHALSISQTKASKVGAGGDMERQAELVPTHQAQVYWGNNGALE